MIIGVTSEKRVMKTPFRLEKTRALNVNLVQLLATCSRTKTYFSKAKKNLAPGNKCGAAGRLASEAERKEIVSKFCDDHKNVLKEKIYTV